MTFGPTGSSTTASQEAAQNLMILSSYYAASGNWAAKAVSVAADRYTLLAPDEEALVIGSGKYGRSGVLALDLSLEATWDVVTGTDYRTAANRAGKDFYCYAVQPVSGTVPNILVSANATAPSGYTTDNSRLIGGFHCLCLTVSKSTLTAWAAATVMAVGQTIKATAADDNHWYRVTAIANDFKTGATEPNWSLSAVGASITDGNVTFEKELHDLAEYVAGDILPASVWGLKHRPTCAPEGMFYEPSCGRWHDIYVASGTGAATASVFGGTISKNRQVGLFLRDMRAVGKRFPFFAEFTAAALGSNNGSAKATAPTTAGGHVDQYGRRLVSHLGGEAFCGALLQLGGESVNGYLGLFGGSFGTATAGPYRVDGSIALVPTYANAVTTARGCAPSVET